MGNETTAEGTYSTAMGKGTHAQAYGATAFGRYNAAFGDMLNWLDGDPLFVIGNGSSDSERSNAFTVLKNGKTGIGTDSPSTNLDVNGTVRIRGGDPGAGKVLVSDDTGTASWSTPSSGDADPVIGNEVTDTANATLIRSGAGTAGDPYKLALNLGNANTWTGAQTFGSTQVTGTLKDTAGGAGTSGQVLQSTGAGTSWTAFSGLEGDGVVGNEVTDAANSTLARSGTGTGVDPYKLALNLSNANTWTNTQTFGSAQVTGTLKDTEGAAGTNGQFLKSTGIGTIWSDVSATADNDWTISGNDQYSAVSGNVGIGTGVPEFKLSVDSDGGILAKGTYDAGATLITSGFGTRLIWYPRKSAFRAGTVAGTQWDDAKVGSCSTAFGINTTASGDTSTAMGGSTTASGPWSLATGVYTIASNDAATALGFGTRASGYYSTAMGKDTTASGDDSTAMGYMTSASGWASTAMGGFTTASGGYSTAMGYRTTAQAYDSVVLGRWNVVSGSTTTWVETDPLFVIGNGFQFSEMPPSRSNALTVLKNGNVGIGQLDPTATLDVAGTVQMFGDWEAKSAGTEYTAPSDGFVVAHIVADSDGEQGYARGETPHAGTPIVRSRASVYRAAGGVGVLSSSLCMPVQKGITWYVTTSATSGTPVTTVYWIPLGHTVRTLAPESGPIGFTRTGDASPRRVGGSRGQGSSAASDGQAGPGGETGAPAVPATLLPERYPVCEPVEVGDVLANDATRPGTFCLSRMAADPSVVGIATEAWPATDEGAAERAQAVTLASSGVGVCKVDTGYGPIAANDLLVASPTPGHAMKAVNPAPGTVLAKALEPLPTGTGTIRVLVMLR
jgi:hypothetical protein